MMVYHYNESATETKLWQEEKAGGTGVRGTSEELEFWCNSASLSRRQNFQWNFQIQWISNLLPDFLRPMSIIHKPLEMQNQYRRQLLNKSPPRHRPTRPIKIRINRLRSSNMLQSICHGPDMWILDIEL